MTVYEIESGGKRFEFEAPDENALRAVLQQGGSAPGQPPTLDEVREANPQVFERGFTPDEIAASNARKNAPPPQRSTGRAVFDTVTDPVGSLAGGAASLYERAGGSEAWANRLGRDVRAVVDSMGPLGAEFAGLSAQPRVPKSKPAPAASPTPRAATEAPVGSADELRRTGGQRIGEAKQSDATVGTDRINEAIIKFERGLDDDALDIDPDLYPTAAKVFPKLKAAAAEPQTLKQLHLLRQKVQNVIDNGVKPNGKPNAEGRIGMKMKAAVDDMIAAHPEGAKFKLGTSQYARAEKASIIEDAMEKARVSVQWQRGNQAGAIRNVLKSLFTNKKYKNLWTPEERKQLRKLGKFGTIEGLGGFGSNSPMAFTIGRVTETILGVPPLGLYVVGAPLRTIANSNKVKGADRLVQQILNGGPEAVARVDKAAGLFSKDVYASIVAQTEGAKRLAAWAVKPGPQTARALATYTSARLNVPHMTERIMAELQGTEQSHADENEGRRGRNDQPEDGQGGESGGFSVHSKTQPNR